MGSMLYGGPVREIILTVTSNSGAQRNDPSDASPPPGGMVVSPVAVIAMTWWRRLAEPHANTTNFDLRERLEWVRVGE